MILGLIVAGGLGTRLSPLTNVIPKPLLPIGQITMLEWQVRRMDAAGVRQIFVSTGYLHELFEPVTSHIRSKYSIDITLVHEDEPNGTFGSALQLFRNNSHWGADSILLVVNADVITDLDLRAFVERGRTSGCVLTVAQAKYSTKIPYGVVRLKDGYVLGIDEKPELTLPVLAGLYAVKPAIFEFVGAPAGLVGIDDIMHSLLDQGEKIASFEWSGSWIDAGTIDALTKANEEFGALQ